MTVARAVVVGQPQSVSGWTLIDTQTAVSDVSDITFRNIPSWARTLQVVGTIRGNRAGFAIDVLQIGFNGRTDNLSYRYAQLNNVSTGATYYGETGSSGVVAYVPGATATAGAFAQVNLLISNGQNPALAKIVSGITADPAQFLCCTTRWDSREIISSIRFDVQLGTRVVAGSTLSLFGAPQ